MTSLETGTTNTLTPVAEHHLVVNDAINRALRRDLGRLTRVLGEPVTAVRRDALIRHVTFLLDQLAAHHRLLDEVIWPAATAVREELDEMGERIRQSHDELDPSFTVLRSAGIDWKRTGDGRRVVLSAVRELASTLEPVLDQDADLLPLACAAMSAAGPGPGAADRRSFDPRGLRLAAPTRVARRMFWLLDDLHPRNADLLLQRTPRSAMWVLRNGFSGAYNRGAHLMWIGGGTGPAV